MQLRVRKGTAEIGGTCIELSHKETTILLDLGAPLSPESQPFDASTLRADALLISHPHQDHYGLLTELRHDIPVYITPLGQSLIEATRLFLQMSPMGNDFRYFAPWQVFQIGSFSITPYLVDHSTPEAYAFLVDTGTHRLFYSGDFRAHGRKSVLFKRIVSDPPKNIDILIMEGTMIERHNDEFPSESAVEDAIRHTIQGQRNMSFMVCSSQNIDRIVSAYRACMTTGKMLVIDLYTAWILEQLKCVSDSVPNMAWERVRVYFPYGQYRVVVNNSGTFGRFVREASAKRVKAEELEASAAEFLYLAKSSSVGVIRKFKARGPINLLYSMWPGYLKPERCKTPSALALAAFQHDPGINFVFAHTSGHATLENLKQFANALNPRMLVPVHTEAGDKFVDHFSNVRRLKDGEVLCLA